jgi:hypothetical protein
MSVSSEKLPPLVQTRASAWIGPGLALTLWVYGALALAATEAFQPLSSNSKATGAPPPGKNGWLVPRETVSEIKYEETV